MTRFEDSPDLFGVGSGVATCGDIRCEWCGLLHNEGEDERGAYDNDGVSWTQFGDKAICECCFAKIEEAVWQRRRDILPWLKRRVKALEKQLAIDMGLVDEFGDLGEE